MRKEKFHSLEKRASHMRESGLKCDLCGAKYAEVKYRGLHLCGDCLNPDYEALYVRDVQHYWCDLRNSWDLS